MVCRKMIFWGIEEVKLLFYKSLVCVVGAVWGKAFGGVRSRSFSCSRCWGVACFFFFLFCFLNQFIRGAALWPPSRIPQDVLSREKNSTAILYFNAGDGKKCVKYQDPKLKL